MKVAVLGTSFMDIKGFALDKYIPNGRNAGKIEYVYGGVGRNVACDIAATGVEVNFVSLVDDSASGDAMIGSMREHGVGTEYVRKSPDGSGTWLAIFDETGDVVANISKRSDLMPICNILDEQGDEIFADADSIAVEIDMEEDIIERIFRLAEKHEKPVYALISNMSIALERMPYIKRTACFVCNQQEAGMFFAAVGDGAVSNAVVGNEAENMQTADPTPEEMEPAGMLELLRTGLVQTGLNAMVVTMGEKGAVYACADGTSGFCPAQKVDVVDTTGAGDAFFAGVCSGLTQGMNMDAACGLGTELSAEVIKSIGNIC